MTCLTLLLAVRFVAGAAANAAPVSLRDDVGSEVVVTGEPLRIVSVSPGATEILFAMGAGKRVVGTCSFCDFPAAAKRCARVGDFANPSLEGIVAARPDLVVSNGGPQRELVEHLRQAGIPTLVLLPRSLQDVYGNIETLGKALRREGAATALIKRMKDRVWETTRGPARPADAGPRVYFEIWSDPYTAIGDDSIPGELIRLAGGNNVAHGARGDYPKLSAEQIIAANPEVIILSHCDDPKGALAQVRRRPGWEHLAAVASGRVYGDLNMDWLLRPGPRLVDGLAQLKGRLQPR